MNPYRVSELIITHITDGKIHFRGKLSTIEINDSNYAAFKNKKIPGGESKESEDDIITRILTYNPGATKGNISAHLEDKMQKEEAAAAVAAATPVGVEQAVAADLLSNKTYLIACHCDPNSELKYGIGKHALLYINNTSLEDPSIRDRIHYIDVTCKTNERSFDNWNTVSKNSIDIIWTVFCPIAPLLFHGRMDTYPDLLTALFETSLGILKENGSLIIPVPTSISDPDDRTKQITVDPTQVETNLRTYLASKQTSNPHLHWNIKIIESVNYPVYIKKENALQFKYLLILTKTTLSADEELLSSSSSLPNATAAAAAAATPASAAAAAAAAAAAEKAAAEKAAAEKAAALPPLEIRGIDKLDKLPDADRERVSSVDISYKTIIPHDLQLKLFNKLPDGLKDKIQNLIKNISSLPKLKELVINGNGFSREINNMFISAMPPSCSIKYSIYEDPSYNTAKLSTQGGKLLTVSAAAAAAEKAAAEKAAAAAAAAAASLAIKKQIPTIKKTRLFASGTRQYRNTTRKRSR